MRLDPANRSFLLILGVALAPLLLLGVVGCAVVPVAAFRAGTDGTGGWSAASWLALAFLLVSAAGTIRGLRSLWRQRQATAALARFVGDHLVDPDDGLKAAAAHEGLASVELIDVAEPLSLTYGIRRPRVVVSRGLLDVVSEEELRAVLAHEGYHVRNFDPLKVVVARAATAAFFFLPAVRHLCTRYLAERELAADLRATRSCGTRHLVGALLKVAGGGAVTAPLAAAAAIGGSGLLDVRLTQLEDGHGPALPPIPALALASTVVGVTAMTVGLAATVTLVGVPIGGGLACGGMWLAAALTTRSM